jgi:AraC-like DNA-binding protein
MLLFISLAGFFLSSILLVYNAGKYRSSIYLGLFFLLLSLYGFFQYVLLYSKSVWLISIFLFNVSIFVSPIYLIGPMLYWYVRSVLKDDYRLKRSDLFHFIPMVVFFIAALPNAFVPWAQKVEVARAVVNDPAFINEYSATMLTKIFPHVSVFLSRPLLVLLYTAWSVVLLIVYLRKRISTAVFSKQSFMKSWLFHLLGFTLILSASQVILLVRTFEMQFSDASFALNLVRVLSIAGLIGLLISPFFFPSILYGLPRMPESSRKPGTSEVKDETTHRGSKAPKVSYETEYLKSIEKKTESCMSELKPYLSPDCNLAYFSKLINVPAHHLAYYFKEIRKQRFNDFRNKSRIEHAKNLIEKGKAGEMTLEAIGSLSGFNSRNAFIADFKKFEGISPGAYSSRYN